MTKTLTEQWRDGEWIVCNVGKCDYYYTDVKCYNGSHKEVIKEESVFLTDYDPDYEILGKVPSYDEWQAELGSNDELLNVQKRLEKKLEIALEVLGIIAMHSKDTVDAVQAACAISQIKEMEGVK